MTSPGPAMRNLRFETVPPPRRQRVVESLLVQQGESNAGALADALLLADRNRSEETLIEAFREGRSVGVSWGQVHAGRSATVWPPLVAPGEPNCLAAALVERVCGALRRQGIVLAQSLLNLPDTRDGPRMASAGFVHLADLVYLAASSDRPEPQANREPLQFDRHSETATERLETIIERTYDATLDCPSLSGLRSIADILAGYRETGHYMPECWLIARLEGRDVGCLLLADHPPASALELIYMGLTPKYRGMGLGRVLIRQALSVARQHGRRLLLLAVDRQNVPAIRLYEAAGFLVWGERRAVMRDLSR